VVVDDPHANFLANPIYRQLGLGYRDKLNSTQIHESDPLQMGQKQEIDEVDRTQILPSIKYASMNYNRFDYLYKFKPDATVKKNDNGNDQNEQSKTETPTINQIINNPCIFDIRGKLIEHVVPDQFTRMDKVQNNVGRPNSKPLTKAERLVSRGRTSSATKKVGYKETDFPMHMKQKVKDKYLRMLVDQKEFLPKLISHNLPSTTHSLYQTRK